MTEHVWLTPQAHRRLHAELAALLTPGHRAGEPGDEDDQTTTLRHTRKARIRQIQDLLSNAVVGQDPPDDGIAEPGMVLTVRYDDTGETETFLLGVRGAEHGDHHGVEVYSPQSPLGAALTGARRGERRTYRVPTGATVRVTLLEAVPYGSTTRRGQAASSPMEVTAPWS
jgi:transcription elongation factor GreA